MTLVVLAFVVPFVLGLFTAGLNFGIWAYRPHEKRHLALATAAAAGVLLLGGQGLVYTVEGNRLNECFRFYPHGHDTLDGAPYHGSADGEFVAVIGDSAVTVLRIKKVK